MRKKINPRRRPATMQDVERAKKAAQEEAVTNAMAIFFTVLIDKGHAGPERLMRIWRDVNELSDAIIKGYVSVGDLRETLKREYGIEV
jgi:hypothetical protein